MKKPSSLESRNLSWCPMPARLRLGASRCRCATACRADSYPGRTSPSASRHPSPLVGPTTDGLLTSAFHPCPAGMRSHTLMHTSSPGTSTSPSISITRDARTLRSPATRHQRPPGPQRDRSSRQPSADARDEITSNGPLRRLRRWFGHPPILTPSRRLHQGRKARTLTVRIAAAILTTR